MLFVRSNIGPNRKTVQLQDYQAFCENVYTLFNDVRQHIFHFQDLYMVKPKMFYMS